MSSISTVCKVHAFICIFHRPDEDNPGQDNNERFVLELHSVKKSILMIA